MATEPENNDPNVDADSETSMQGPHNRFVLGYYGSPREAQGLLEAQLPDTLKRVLKLEDLVVENSHFIDERMAEVESDLLFRIPRCDREDEDAYVYVLWEHQRRRDSLMALRMWIYMGMIYRLLANEDRLLPGVKLPFVYPIVLFQGTEGWKKGLVLEDLIDVEGLDPELHRWVPRFEIDLIRLDEDSPRIRPEAPIARLGLSLMRAVMNRKVGEWLEENIEELNLLYGDNRSPVVLILSYALLSGAGLTTEEFQTIINEKGDPKMKYETGSVAEQLVDRNKKEIVLRMIAKGMKDQEISEIVDLPLNAVAEIRKDSQKNE
ncbi:MAG: Rpn family recombination-promoting nuclease/putative transposase [Verrucomicrobiales bacterium]|nr:Rpn family recombination-promoting nuclease/putative transposase [Verrucomicrobiales bacterium]